MAGMEPGPEHLSEVEYKVLDGMQSEMSVSGLLGYLQVWGIVIAAPARMMLLTYWAVDLDRVWCCVWSQSWSAYVTYRKKHPEAPDPLIEFKEEYKAAMGFSDDGQRVTVTWPVFLIMAKGPQPA